MKASIIIPSYNACERLQLNLLALNMQDYDRKSFEVIVIDNGSMDETSSMVSSLDRNFALKLIRIEQNQGRAKARNLGILEANGDIIIFNDSDMLPEREFVKKHLQEHYKPKKVVCGANWDKLYTYYYKDFKGTQLKAFKEVLPQYKQPYKLRKLKDKQCLIQVEDIKNGTFSKNAFTNLSLSKAYDNAVEVYGKALKGYVFPWSFFVTNNCSVSKASILEVGLFDESYQGWGCEDLDLGYRLYKSKCEFLSSDIRSIHQEHPVAAKEDAIKNIYAFTEKYDSIDVLLFYFTDKNIIKVEAINDIVMDVLKLEGQQQAVLLLMLFKDMLKVLRGRMLKGYISENITYNLTKSTAKQITSNLGALEQQCNNVMKLYNCEAFVEAFRSLAYGLYKIKLKELQ